MHRGQSRGSQTTKIGDGKFIKLAEMRGICIIGLGDGRPGLHVA